MVSKSSMVSGVSSTGNFKFLGWMTGSCVAKGAVSASMSRDWCDHGTCLWILKASSSLWKPCACSMQGQVHLARVPVNHGTARGHRPLFAFQGCAYALPRSNCGRRSSRQVPAASWQLPGRGRTSSDLQAPLAQACERALQACLGQCLPGNSAANPVGRRA